MANIASQEKRIRRAERERQENRRYVSAARTHLRRMRDAVEAGDSERADAEHRAFTSQIDRAMARGGLHKRAGARQKSRAARVRAGG